MEEHTDSSTAPNSMQRMRNRFLFAVYAVTILCGLGLLLVFFVETFSRQFSWWGKLLLIGFMAICILLWMAEKREALQKKQSLGERARDIESWQALASLLLLVASALPNLFSMLRPMPAVEDRPGLIQDIVSENSSGIAESNRKQDKSQASLERIERLVTPEPEVRAPILDRINGLWGEAGCDVVWKIEVSDARLRASVFKKPAELPEYTFVASIVAFDGFTLQTVGEEPANAKGMAATFELNERGAIRTLLWRDRVRDVPLSLRECTDQ